MHKAIFLEGTLRFTIAPDGPILIKAGESSGVDPVLPDMRFVRSQEHIYIPGPSIKGVVRAQAERICRSLDGEKLQQTKQKWRVGAFGDDEPRVPLADNPLGSGTKYGGLDDTDYSSGRAIEDMKLPAGPERSAIVYRRSSFVSQVFGHTSLAGRVRFADAYSADLKPAHIEERNGVAIDRIYGSVAVGPFNYEVVVGGTFSSRIDFKNLTLAQLGLLGLALRDLAEGRVGIGFGKSRGLGRVKVTFDRMTIRYPTCELDNGLSLLGSRHICATNQLAGLGAFASSDAYRSYALPTEDVAPMPDGLSYAADEFMGVELKAGDDAQVRAIWKACMPAWRQEIGL
ncbi:MAG TPA: RAMP superfamily CRISPR-associated protein [Kouleothrix sp.]|nr:RAMP superfamily CRISPR-associated protein [Kouleothrix sp.]